MTLQVIIKGKNSYGKTRSEQESNLRKDGLIGMDDDKYNKCKWLERKIKEDDGASVGFINQAKIHEIFKKIDDRKGK